MNATKKAKTELDVLDERIAAVGILRTQHKAAEDAVARAKEEHERMLADFEDSDAGRRRLRQSQDALLIAEATAKKLGRDLKSAAAELIHPTRSALETVREALREARADEDRRVLAAIRPLFQDPDRAFKVAASIYTDRRHQLRGGLDDSAFHAARSGEPMDAIAASVLVMCRSFLRRIDGSLN